MSRSTVVDSIPHVEGPPDNAAELDDELAALRRRYRDGFFQRYLDRVPRLAPSVSIFPGASIAGEVTLAEEVSIWHGCVLRGDLASIEVRERTNIQDGTVVHVANQHSTFVAEDVIVGHRAVLHGCRVGGGSLVGIQATVLNGAVIGEGSIIAACALVTEGMEVPPHSMVMGVPGKVVRTLTAETERVHRALAAKYARLAEAYRDG